MKISDIIIETTAGSIATVAMPMGGMRKRPNPSVFAKTKKTKKKLKAGITGAVAGGILGSAGGPLGTAAGAYLGHKIQKGAKKKKNTKEGADDTSR